MARKVLPSLQPDIAAALAKLLPASLSAAEADLATPFYLSLGFDAHISGLGSICKDLASLLSEDVELQPPLRQYWRRARKVNEKILGDPETRSAAMPESGVTQRYPVLTCLGTSAYPDQASQIASLKRILLAGCILRAHDFPGGNCVNRAADEIRLSCELYRERHPAVLKLPAGPLTLGYLVELRNAARGLQQPLASASLAYGFYSAVLKLTEYVLRFRRFPRARRASELDAVENPLSDLGVILPAEVDPDEAILADPEQLLQLSEPPTDAGDELSQEGFTASGLRTQYFLAQSESGVLWQRGRISPYEMPALQRLLRSLPAMVAQGHLNASEGLMVGLVAATGLDPEDLLSMGIGIGADFTWSGTYRRKIARPDGAFDPAEQPGGRSLYEGQASGEIAFELPDPVKALFQPCRPDAAEQRVTLGDALGFRANKLEPSVQTRLQELCGRLLKEHVNTRLAFRHLRLVLRHATYEESRDPLLVYLIAARPNLAPPTQMYYGSISTDRVLDVHRAVMRRIFGSP